MCPRTKEQNESIRIDRKAAILNAALHVFAEDTYHGASMNKIANQANVSKGLIYNYFTSKEELLQHLIFEISDRFISKMECPEGELQDSDVVHFIEVSIDMIIEDLTLSKLFFSVCTQQSVMDLMAKKIFRKIVPFIIAMRNYFTVKGHEDSKSVMRYFGASLDGIQMHILMDPSFPIESVKNLFIQQFVGNKVS